MLSVPLRTEEPEFQQVDERWQFLNKDNSASNRVYQECLTAAGVTPQKTTEDVWAQAQEASAASSNAAQTRRLRSSSPSAQASRPSSGRIDALVRGPRVPPD